MKNLLLTLTIICLIFSGCTTKTTTPITNSESKSDSTYSYDGDIDPAQFQSYNKVDAEFMNPMVRIISLSSENLKPKYVVIVVQKIYNTGMIIYYAYYNDNKDLMYFRLNPKTGHYEKIEPENEGALNIITYKLNTLHGISDS